LEKGCAVKIADFGSFVLREKPKRIGRNPKTLVKVMIARRAAS
jgi:nucleoid DNA-binding protein